MKIEQQESVGELTRKGACLAFFTAYGDLDTARMIGLAAPAATVHFLPLGEDGRGSFWEFGKTVWDLLIDCFPDLTNTVNSLRAEGNTITVHVTIGGKQAKDFLGVANQNLSFNSDHVFVFQFDEKDQIESLTINWNHDEFIKQLGG